MPIIVGAKCIVAHQPKFWVGRFLVWWAVTHPAQPAAFPCHKLNFVGDLAR